MKRYYYLLAGLLLLFTGCKEEVNNPTDSGTPGIENQYDLYFDKDVCVQRRKDLLANLPGDALVIITTAQITQVYGGATSLFRPAPTFYYLTGFYEPNAVAVIRKKRTDLTKVELIMFVEKKDNTQKFGPEGAVNSFGADSAYEFDKFGPMMKKYLSQGYFQSIYANFADNQSVYTTLTYTVASIPPVNVISGYANRLRLIKSANEITAIRRSTAITTGAFNQSFSLVRPGKYEYDVANLFQNIRVSSKSTGDAFLPIIASGPNINIIHYFDNTRQMQSGELVMMDYGTEHGFYAADITCTLPVNGKYSEKQKVVYEIVRSVHEAIIAAARPGVTFKQLDNKFYQLTIDGLLEKGIITGNRDQIISSGRFRQYIPALLGHPVGLDVHDPSPADASGSVTLAKNMVYAFEPHIYLSYGDQTVKSEYWEVSVRIEDMILITNTGCEVLSANLPYKFAEIENLMK